MTTGHLTIRRPLRYAPLALAAALGACTGMNQTEPIPAGSGTLLPQTSLERHYTASLGTGALTSSIRPHWTFTVEATVTGASAGVEEPLVRMSVYQDTLTIPTTVDMPLGGGAASGSASIEADTDCSRGQTCSLGFKVRFERQDVDAAELGLSWSGTIHTAVEGELGDTSPGDLIVTEDPQ